MKNIRIKILTVLLVFLSAVFVSLVEKNSTENSSSGLPVRVENKTAHPVELISVFRKTQTEGDRLFIFSLLERNNSGEGGVAVLEEVGGRTKLTIDLLGGPVDTSQPARILLGNCQDKGRIMYNLNPIINGGSETIIDLTIDELTSDLPVSISVYAESGNPETETACGEMEIVPSSTPPENFPTATNLI